MKILNIILSLLIALMAGSCVYPEDIVGDVAVSISGISDDSGVAVYGKLDSGNMDNVSECGFELFKHGKEIGDNEVKVSVSDFRHYYDYYHNQYGDETELRVGGYSCRAYVIIGGVKIYSDEYRFPR